MVFVTISDTNDSLQTCNECRRKLAARGGVIERRASPFPTFGGVMDNEQRIEHPMRLGDDSSMIQGMLGIADGLDDALLVDFAAGFDIHFGRPVLRIVSVAPGIRDDLDLGG